MADAAEELDVVALEAHPRAAAEAEAPAGELRADLVDDDGKAGRKPLDHDHQGRAVRLPGSQVAQHEDSRVVGTTPGPPPYFMTCSPLQRLKGESPYMNWPQVPESATTL